MAVILFSYKKEAKTTAFFRSALQVSIIFLLVLAMGYMNYYSLKMKLAFAEYVETGEYNEKITGIEIETDSKQNAETEYNRTGKVYGRIYKISEKEHSIMVWMNASEIIADSNRDRQTYSGKMKLIAYLPAEADVKPGQRVTLSGKLKRPDVASNPGAFDARSYYENQEIFLILYSAKILEQSETYDRVAAGLMELKERIGSVYNIVFHERYASVVRAMLLGEKSDMDEELKSLYQMNGMAHILAISGVHIAILGMGLFKLLKKLLGSYYLCGSVTFCIILLYGTMTGMSGSTVRAIIMIGIFLLGQALGRTVDLLTSMGFACMFMMLFNPYIIQDAGFQLSFLAIAGLGMIHPVLIRVFGKGGRLQQTLFAGISVNLALAPIIIYYYYELPLYSVLLNLAVVPLVPVIIFFGLIVGVFGMISLPMSQLCAFPVACILKLYDVLGDICTKLPYHSIHIGHITITMIVVYYALIAFALWMMDRMKEKRNRTCSIAFLVVAMFALCSYEYLHLDRGFMVVFLDVGQGDGILVRTDSGINIMIDGGSSDEDQMGKYVLAPALKYYAMSEVDYALVSHADKDHISGLLYLLQTDYTGITIHNIVIPLYGDRRAFAELINLAEQKGVNILYADAGLSMDLGDCKMSCLYPDANVSMTDTNSLSGVWKLSSQSVAVLFPGDLDAKGEQYILGKHIDISCDVLKVGHHGSKYSSSAEFVEACKMEQAVISCGKRNSYGHPHPETLMRLEDCGCIIYQTKERGAVVVCIEDGRVSVEGFVK